MLDWDYSGNSPDQKATYRGFTIHARHDECPTNPFEDWDGHWPMLVEYDRGKTSYDKIDTDMHSVDDVLYRFSAAQLVHDQIAIATALGTTIEDLTSYSSALDEPVKYCTDSDILLDGFTEYFGELTGDARFRVLEELYDLLGIPCLHTTSRGYCQGDWARLFIVATPAAQEQLRSQPEGMSDEEWAKALREDMEQQAKLYGHWAWGNVYGYEVEAPDGTELDSCWGYYGDPHESGLEEAAIEAIDYEIKASRSRRFARLKELILNKVGLDRRAALLEEAGAAYA